MKLPVLSGHHKLVPCRSCAFLHECGGLDGQQSLWGCFDVCSVSCMARGCDWTCPASADFVDRMRDVGDFSTKEIALTSIRTTGLPTYVPLIHHGYGRGAGGKLTLDVAVAAVSIKDVFRHRADGRLDVVAENAGSLRRKFGLREDAKMLLVCVSDDRRLEAYWAHRRAEELPARLAKLGLTGITLPNYSFFTDAPRTHVLWNRRRMLKVGEELSAAGVPVAPHLNAITKADWQFWTEFIRAHSSVNVIVKEFQTGLHRKEQAKEAIASLRQLQSDVGRPLRLIAVGATGHIKALRDVCSSVTFVDSSPFMRAMKRRGREPGLGGPKWKKVSAIVGRPLLDLLNGNIREHAAFVARQVRA